MIGDPAAIERVLGFDTNHAAERMLARIRRYVEHETPSHHGSAVRALAATIAADLTGVGADIEQFDAGDAGTNTLARFNTQHASDTAPVVMLAHIDTVHPTGSFLPLFRVADGRAFGPGIFDMKSGLSLFVEALHVLRERGVQPARPVELLITCDEEVGSQTSRALIEDAARRAAFVLVPEPCMPDGGVKTGRKGVVTYRLEAHGVAAHAGIDPGIAVSATLELAHQITDVAALADHARGTTINFGVIAGGTASNVVPAFAHATVDVRLEHPDEGPRIAAALQSLRPHDERARVQALLEESRPPLVRTPAIAALYERARTQAAGLGVDLTEGRTGGGSDGSLAAAAGAATLDGLGPRGAGAHTLEEHIVVDDLPFRLAFVCQLLTTL